MCIEFYIVKIVCVCALMACTTFQCLVTHLLIHRMYAHIYVRTYVDVSRVLEESATASLGRDKLLAKTGISFLILPH